MSIEKIEVNCSFCGATLRVEAEHAGKRLRCPSCNNISNIPGEANYGESQGYVPAGGQAGSRATTFRDSAFDDEPRAQSTGQATGGESVFVGRLKSDTSGFVIGLVGLILNLVCPIGCVSPLFVIANSWGLFKALSGTGNLRQAAIILNSLALGIGLLRTGVLLLFGM